MILLIVWAAMISLVYLCKKLNEKGTVPGIGDLEHILERVVAVKEALDTSNRIYWPEMKELAMHSLTILERDVRTAIEAKKVK